MYRFVAGLNDAEPDTLEEADADVLPEGRDASPGVPVVLKRGAVAMNTESSGG